MFVVVRRFVPLLVGVLLSVRAAPHAFAGGLAFTEIAQSAGLTVIPDRPNTVQGCYAGGAVGDFNNNGWQDLFVPAGGFEPDKLYINNGDGTFTDQAAAWGVDATHLGVSAAVGDFNNDGWLDIFVLSRGEPDDERPGAHRLYRNNGDGTFTDVAEAAGVRFTSPVIPDGFGAAFGDYDLDGYLDLAVAGWYLNSGGNRLFRNNGDGTFTDVTTTAILANMMPVRGFSPRFLDMDGDGYPELLWVADFRTSRYLVNNRDGTFSDRTVSAGVGIESNGMGHCVGDFNNNGLPDWYVTSIMQPLPPIGMPNGNVLYINQGAHHYTQVAQAAGVDDGGWGWGAIAADLDHDGLLDIVAVNGWYTINWINDPAVVFHNRGGLQFDEIAAQVGIEHYGQARGLINVDFDNDGDQDVIIFAFQEPVRLYRNDSTGPDRNWLRVFLDTSGRPAIAPNGFGAKVVATAAGQSQTRWIDGGCNYLSQSELSAHFGLGGAAVVERLRIEWPDRRVTQLSDVPVNQTLVVPAGLVGDFDGDGRVALDDLSRLLAALGQCEGDDRFAPETDIDGDGCVTMTDLLDLLLHFGMVHEPTSSGP